jgi:TPR repeat protein
MHYQKAANKGHAAAMVRLGVLLYDGEHVLTNYEEAARWFMEAANQDDPRGMYLLGRMYESGDGVIESAEEARRWISKAAMHGFPQAKEWIETNLPKSPKWLTQLVNPNE